MKNTRNAGRKPELTLSQICDLKKRWQAGEKASALAEECGVSRQALYKHFRNTEYVPAKVEYYTDDTLSTLIEADLKREQIRIVNYVSELSRRAFGYEENPEWEDFLGFMEDCFLRASGVTGGDIYLLCEEGTGFSPSDIGFNTDGEMLRFTPDSCGNVPFFRFSKKDLLLYRSDTDGFQLKALSADRRFFVKAQAVMAGVLLRDWAVEIVATGLCHQFGIACVEQKHCRFAYASQVYDAVYSPNYELDGYTFISFENLLERKNMSSRSDEFIRLDAVSKLKWCAGHLALVGNIPYEKAERYMLDLAVIDCLVGNVDRHTRNFGLFFNNGKFEVPLIFDSGMGLFEHDCYRDQYMDFDEAMRNVYVSPYGEDPFDFLEILDREFCLKKTYPGIAEPDYGDVLNTPFALEYMKRMKALWQKLG